VYTDPSALFPTETKTTLPEPSQTTSGAEKLKQIQKLAEEKLQKLPEARLSFAIGNTEIVVREVVQKSISVVTAFKDILGAAISAEPCAGLAWAGIMSILPVSYPPLFLSHSI
jgi:ADP-ribosylglycohydrolase